MGGAKLQPPAFMISLGDVAMMGKPIEQCRGHLRVAKYGLPLSEVQVGRDDDRVGLVKFRNQVEQQLVEDSARDRGGSVSGHAISP